MEDLTITSTDLLDKINTYRSEIGKGKIRHDNLMQSLKKDIQLKKLMHLSSYLDVNNQERKCYLIPEVVANNALNSYKQLKPQIMCERETGALCAIEQVLHIELERQFPVLNYRVDGYHKESNTVYEIDEGNHYVNGELKKSCVKRQQEIEQKLGCTFVRIKV